MKAFHHAGIGMRVLFDLWKVHVILTMACSQCGDGFFVQIPDAWLLRTA